MRLALLLFLSLVATTAGAAEAGFCPPDSPQSGGMRDIMLIYEGGTPWKAEEFLPYVAYLDGQGQPKDWFYDAFLFLMFGGAPSGATYIDGPSNRADWVHFLDVTFAQNTWLGGLDQQIEALGAKLGDAQRVVPVIVMIPYPSARQKEFGDVDGDGVSEDLSKEADRTKAVRWFLDEALARWKALAPRHLKLWGFYWMNEGIGPRDETVVKATAALIHERGVGFHWIPWYRAPSTNKWSEPGIDFAVVQPNYAFTSPARGFVLGDDTRLTNNANDARSLGLGFEMETPFAMPGGAAARWVFRQYLNHGVDELDGYMRGAVRAYYQGTDVIARLARSANPGERQLYDDLYQFHKGTYKRRPTSLVEGARCLLQMAGGKPKEEPRLTDGVWMTRAGREPCLVPAKGTPVVATLELPCPTLVDDVRVHLAAKGDAGFPSLVRVLTADAGSTAFTLRAETTEVAADRCGEWLAGFAAAHFPAVPAGRLRIELSGASGEAALDEIVVPPAAQALWGVAARLEGEVAPTSAGAATLTEGLGGESAVVWRRGPARVTFDCHQIVGSQLRVRVRKAPGKPSPSLRVRTSPATPWRKGEVAWQSAGYALLTARLDPEPLDQLTLEVAGAGQVALEDVQMTPAANLAQAKPYALEPGFTGKYPDSGGELTDGKLCETGFGDGKTVGWFGGHPSVILDLGSVREVDGFGLHVQGGGYAGVRDPVRVTASLSSDGASWRRVAATTTFAEKTGEQRMEEETCTLGWMRASFPRAAARFVRVDVDSRAWAMLSELAVTSAGANVAAGCTYHLSPVPTSEQRYADKDAYLTDGVYTSQGSGWRNSVGWSEGEPRVTLDLLQARPVSLIRAHVSGGGGGGVWFPEEMRVELSTDGKSWSEPLISRERAPENGTSHTVQFRAVRAPAGTTARYIRYTFRRRGWLMVDELDAFGLP